MSAPLRHAAAAPLISARSTRLHDVWREAVSIRQEWLTHGLSTQAADRQAAERHLTAIYAEISRPRPRFEWVDSPLKALPLVSGLPSLEQLYTWVRDPRSAGKPPLASDLAMAASRVRAMLSASISHSDPEFTPATRGGTKRPWPDLPAVDALDAGVPLGIVLHRGLRTAMHRSLAQGFRQPIRAVLSRTAPMPVCWYGQQDAAWIGYYDSMSRLGLASYGPRERDALEPWAGLARSCGWWWPDEDLCVVVERPEWVLVEPVPKAWHGELRLRAGGVGYRDGWKPLA